MKHFYVISALILCNVFSCKNIEKTNSTQTLTLIVLGLADSGSIENKGYGINLFCHINLENDSVFYWSKSSVSDSNFLEKRIGFLKGLSINDTVVKGLKKLSDHPCGKIIGNKIPNGSLFCGLNLYLKHIKGDSIKHYLFTNYKLDSTLENFTNYILSLRTSKSMVLKLDTSKFNENKIIIPIVNSNYFDLSPVPFKTKADVNFELP